MSEEYQQDNVHQLGKPVDRGNGNGGGGNVEERLRVVETNVEVLKTNVAHIKENMATKTDIEKLKVWILSAVLGAYRL